MEMVINIQVGNVEKETVKRRENEFLSEFAQGLFWVEIDQKEEQLKEFIEAFENLDDKDSFNGQYLEVLIDGLKSDIIEKKKQFKV